MDWSRLLAIAEAESDQLVQALPADLRAEAKRVPVTFEAQPDQALQDDGIEPDTLGLFFGDAFPDSSVGTLPLPPSIALFLQNIWDFAEGDEAAYRKEIRRTLLHELGHYLGLDENDLAERGLE